MSASSVETNAAPVLGPDSAGMLLTPEEFDAVTDYDDGFQYELIRGVLVVTPIPGAAEAGPNDELGALLRRYQHDDPCGAALDDTLPERYVRTSVGRRRADRVMWCGLGRRVDPLVDVPTIAVEFVSLERRDWRRDYVEKRQEYLEAGDFEYWVIDRFRRTMTVFQKSPESANEVVVAEHEIYRTASLLGFELVLARLLAAADRWA